MPIRIDQPRVCSPGGTPYPQECTEEAIEDQIHERKMLLLLTGALITLAVAVTVIAVQLLCCRLRRVPTATHGDGMLMSAPVGIATVMEPSLQAGFSDQDTLIAEHSHGSMCDSDLFSSGDACAVKATTLGGAQSMMESLRQAASTEIDQLRSNFLKVADMVVGGDRSGHTILKEDESAEML